MVGTNLFGYVNGVRAEPDPPFNSVSGGWRASRGRDGAKRPTVALSAAGAVLGGLGAAALLARRRR